ncbi:MAG: nucleotidyltransferase domain-containing protein [Prosthecobacter sp.]|uniref:nucleotidyltransferase domain-containing protein n=1 Tax=Prosthecobacter sp. TaxID=1965333 RepID=UPI0038FE6598
MVAKQDIEEYCQRIAREFRPERIILFGSHAYGTPDENSDVDLMVVMPRQPGSRQEQDIQIRRRVQADFPVDLLVRDPLEVAQRLRENDTFMQVVTQHGRVMYENRHA